MDVHQWWSVLTPEVMLTEDSLLAWNVPLYTDRGVKLTSGIMCVYYFRYFCWMWIWRLYRIWVCLSASCWRSPFALDCIVSVCSSQFICYDEGVTKRSNWHLSIRRRYLIFHVVHVHVTVVNWHLLCTVLTAGWFVTICCYSTSSLSAVSLLCSTVYVLYASITVIAMLLQLSGDVETNPGPGKYYVRRRRSGIHSLTMFIMLSSN